MTDESNEPKDLLEIIGDGIGECLPDSWRTEEVGSLLGGICGFLVGWVVVDAALGWIRATMKENKP